MTIKFQIMKRIRARIIVVIQLVASAKLNDITHK